MSGGHWNYAQHQVEEALQDVGDDAYRRWPETGRIFEALAKVVPQIMHDMDWDLSGDTCIEQDVKFDMECVEKLKTAILRPAEVKTK